MYICSSIYLFIRIYRRIFTHMYTHVPVYICKYTYLHVHVGESKELTVWEQGSEVIHTCCQRAKTRENGCKGLYMNMYTYVYKHACIYVCMCINMCI